MILFLSYRTVDQNLVKVFKDKMLSFDKNLVFTDHLNQYNEADWKDQAYNKIHEADKFILLITKKTKESSNINWEYQMAKSKGKDVICICLDDTVQTSDCPGYIEPIELLPLVPKLIIERINGETILRKSKELLLEEIKLLVASTEKVTDQRLSINNLFLTICVTILSSTFLVLKELINNDISYILILFLIFLTFMITVFWKRMVSSYGSLNKGKFKLIAELEHQLKTDLFQREWKILISKEVGYKSNTDTEKQTITFFRVFLIIIAVLELLYLLKKNG